MGGTIKSPETRVTANDVVKSTENIKPVPEAQKAPVINQTKEELDNHEAKLTGSNLDKIGVSRSEALKLAQEVLNISNPFDITEFKNAIKKYQDEHNIGIDGKIGKETYYEMKAGDVFKECREVDEMIPYLKEILPNLTGKSQNSLLLKPVLDKLRKNPEFQQRLRTDIELNRVVINFEKKLNVYKNSPEGKKAYENAKTKFTDLHEVVNNPTPENIKNFVNDPTLLLAGGLLFLFGVGTDMSFMKRLGILLGGFIFGPYAMKKLGVGKFWDQLDESADHGAIDDAQGAAVETSKETADWVTKNAKNAWGAITGFFGEAGDKIGELKLSDFEGSFSKVSSKLESANKSKDKSEKIKEESLKNLTGVLLSDKIFVNLTQEDLEEINKDNINQYLTTESQEKLTKEDKGVIKKYIVLLSEQFQTGDTRVRDLLLTTEMVDKIKEAYYKTDTEFVPEAKTFNDEINKLIKSLLATQDKEKHFAALQLAKALKDGDISKFDINSFKLGDYKTDVKNVIDVFNEYKNTYTPAVEELEKIDISDDDKKAFKYDYDLFIGVSKTEIKDSELKADFEKKIFEKKLEIFKKAQELGINKLKDETGKEVVVDDYLEGLEAEKEEKENEEFENEKTKFHTEFGKVEIPTISEGVINVELYNKYSKQIQKAYDRLNKLNSNNYFTTSWNNFVEFINSFANDNLVEKKNLSKIDKYKAKMIKEALYGLKNIQFELENNFDTSLDGLSASDIQEKWEIVRGFKNEDLKEEKQEELRKEFKEKINDKISSINELEKYKELCNKFDLEDEYKNRLDTLKEEAKLQKEAEEKLKKPKTKETTSNNNSFEDVLKKIDFISDFYMEEKSYKDLYEFVKLNKSHSSIRRGRIRKVEGIKGADELYSFFKSATTNNKKTMLEVYYKLGEIYKMTDNKELKNKINNFVIFLKDKINNK